MEQTKLEKYKIDVYVMVTTIQLDRHLKINLYKVRLENHTHVMARTEISTSFQCNESFVLFLTFIH